MKKTDAPKHLSAASAAWFREVSGSYEMGGDHLRVLQLACESWDMAQEARAILAVEGIVITAATGATKSHPAIPILNSAADRFLKCVTALGLDADDVPQEVPGRRDHHLRSVK